MTKHDLKKWGLKATIPRLNVLKILERNLERHYSAEAIYQELIQFEEDASIATIYRILNQFEEVGLVTKHNFEGGYSVYELNDGTHHDHLVCQSCGAVTEFIDELIEQRQKQIAEKAGYEIVHHSLNIYGICTTCQFNKRKTSI